MSDDKFRCGDLVVHRPSDERWTVAWCEGDDIAWCGWPSGMARASDCEMLAAATDEQHHKLVEAYRQSEDEPRRDRVLRLYGGPKP